MFATCSNWALVRPRMTLIDADSNGSKRWANGERLEDISQDFSGHRDDTVEICLGEILMARQLEHRSTQLVGFRERLFRARGMIREPHVYRLDPACEEFLDHCRLVFDKKRIRKRAHSRRKASKDGRRQTSQTLKHVRKVLSTFFDNS